MSVKLETRTIEVAALARVEGEGALHVHMNGGEVEDVRLTIYEPPRFYEAFLRGRDFKEVPDITARICGICPVAYQMGSVHALEKALGLFHRVDPAIHRLRDLLYCGEWIESHILHMFLLHLPDFLGYESAFFKDAATTETVQRALRIKKLGNEIVDLLGGRSVHPVGVCVGGFYRAPDEDRVRALLPEVEACLDDMCALALFLAEAVEYPPLDRDYEFLSLMPDHGYPMNRGRIVSSRGLDIDQEEFLDHIEEVQVPHSTAFHARIRQRGSYAVGPLARINLAADRLHPRAAELVGPVCDHVKAPLPWTNSFLGLPARALETVHALALTADILREYQRPERSRIPIKPQAGQGGHGTEAPRGICWHQYRTDHDGTILDARIIPPTSQNQSTIEEDLREVASQLVDEPDEKVAQRCEHLIRNYDPCISCSVHFLDFSRSWEEPRP